MKPLIYLLRVSIILLVLNLFSCKKYLDEKSDKILVVPKTTTDLQGILDDNYIMNTQTPSFGETSSDDYFVSENDYNSFGEMGRQAYTWRLNNYTFGNDWDQCYSAIYNANYCLDEIDKAEKNSQNDLAWNNVKGSAFFFRAYNFLNLLWTYSKAYNEETAAADLGIVLRLNSDFNIPSSRASIKKSYEQVISDLNQANQYLPDNPLHVMRPSKAASYALLGRTYLSMREYDSALKYAGLSLQIKNDLLDYNSDDVDSAAYNPFQPFNEEIIFYTNENYGYSPRYPSYALIDTTLYSDYDSNDLRRSIFFFANNGYHSFKGSYTGSQDIFFSGIATDEMFLTRAECYARTGKMTEALNDLNTLLIKRWRNGYFSPFSAATSQEAVSLILKERRKELLMRGLRWIEIKRLNKEGANIIPLRLIGSQTFSLDPNSGKYALPLPIDVINHSDIPQN